MNYTRSDETLAIILRRNDSSVTLRSDRGNGEKGAYFKDMRLYNLLDATVLYFMESTISLI